MGVRTNIEIVGDSAPIYVYSHWFEVEDIKTWFDYEFESDRVGDVHYYIADFVDQLGSAKMLSGVGTTPDDGEVRATVDARTGEWT